jgi:transposase-like protein
MDRSKLAAQLESGRSIESIARELGRDPSTVAYWVNKHGLVSAFAAKHAPRGGLAREQLEPLVAAGLSIRAIAQRLEVSYATVQHWLKKHGLKTRRAAQPRGADARTVERECPIHGLTTFVKYSSADHHRCLQCRKDRVVARRRKVKAMLVEEAAVAACCAAMTAAPARSSSIISTRPRSLSGWVCAASPARWSAAARRRASAYCCARTATQRSKRASRPSDNSYYGRRAAPPG